jgi:soluble lytic murein transglycosylase-like protein
VRSVWLFLLLTAALPADEISPSRALQHASIEKQRLSVLAQEKIATRSSTAPEPAVQMPCEPSSPDEIGQIIDDGARRSGLDSVLVRAVVRKESSYNSCATSPKGAQGLMQLMPSVQAQFGVTKPYDPWQNVDAGTKLLKQLLGQYGGDLPRALGAYNAGSGRVDQWGGVPPFPETIDYVSTILGEISPK